MITYPRKIIIFITSHLKQSHIENHIKKNHKYEYDKIFLYTKWLNNYNPIFTERLYCIFNNIHKRPHCLTCKKQIIRIYNNFKFKIGYSKFCCQKCVGTNIDIKLKKEKTCIKHFNVKYPQQSKTVKNKSQLSCIKKYGVNCILKSKEIRQKIKNTCLNRYGVDNPVKNKLIKEKIKQTNKEKTGYNYTFENPKVQEKIKQTNLNNYGVENVFSSEKIKKKLKNTWLKNLGTDNPWKSKKIIAKIRETKMKNGTYTPLFPQIGKNECKLLNEQEVKNNCKIDRNFKIGPFFPDGYCHETNTIYEIYEQWHYSSKEQIEYDKTRQEYIINKLSCKFIIIQDIN